MTSFDEEDAAEDGSEDDFLVGLKGFLFSVEEIFKSELAEIGKELERSGPHDQDIKPIHECDDDDDTTASTLGMCSKPSRQNSEASSIDNNLHMPIPSFVQFKVFDIGLNEEEGSNASQEGEPSQRRSPLINPVAGPMPSSISIAKTRSESGTRYDEDISTITKIELPKKGNFLESLNIFKLPSFPFFDQMTKSKSIEEERDPGSPRCSNPTSCRSRREGDTTSTTSPVSIPSQIQIVRKEREEEDSIDQEDNESKADGPCPQTSSQQDIRESCEIPSEQSNQPHDRIFTENTLPLKKTLREEAPWDEQSADHNWGLWDEKPRPWDEISMDGSEIIFSLSDDSCHGIRPVSRVLTTSYAALHG